MGPPKAHGPPKVHGPRNHCPHPSRRPCIRANLDPKICNLQSNIHIFTEVTFAQHFSVSHAQIVKLFKKP